MKWELLSKKLKVQSTLLRQLIDKYGIEKYDNAVTSTGPLKPKEDEMNQREKDKQAEIEFKEMVRGEKSTADSVDDALKEYKKKKDPFPPKKREKDEHIITAKDAEELKAETTKEREAEEAEMEAMEEEAILEEEAAEGEIKEEKEALPKENDKKEIKKPEKPEKKEETKKSFLGEKESKWINILTELSKKDEDTSEGFEPGEYVFVSGDGDGIGSKVEQKVLQNDLVGLLEQSATIQQGQAYLKKSFEDIGGKLIMGGGDDNLAVIESSQIDKVEEIRNGYSRVTGGFTITFGVGNTMREAVRALVYGKLTGKNKLVFWKDELEDELRELSRPQSVRDKYEEHGLLETEEEAPESGDE